MRTAITGTLITALALAVAACGDAPHPAGWSAENVRVCQHYATQRDSIKNLAEPSVTDLLRVVTWVAADAAEATPGTPLSRDFSALSDQLSATAQPGASAPAGNAAAARVRSDCAALGVDVG